MPKKVKIANEGGHYIQLHLWPSMQQAEQARDEEERRKVDEIHISYGEEESEIRRQLL